MTESSLTQNIELTLIRIDGGTQQRIEISEETVADYAERIADLPPVELVYDGTTYWLWDGFHRYHSANRSGLKSIASNIRPGTLRDAILLSLGANSTHGKPRTQLEKRNAIKRILEDKEWAQWSDRVVAKHCNVSHPTVGEVRREIEAAKVVKLPVAPEPIMSEGKEPPTEESNIDPVPNPVQNIPETPKPTVLVDNELAAAMADEPADDKPDMPWVHYNGRIDSIVGLLHDVKKKCEELPKSSGADASFSGWCNAEQWDKYWLNAIAIFENHRVANWANTAQATKLPGGRNFLYVHEVEKKGNKAKKKERQNENKI